MGRKRSDKKQRLKVEALKTFNSSSHPSTGVQHSDCGVVVVGKSNSFLTLRESLSSSAAASVRIAILSGDVMSSLPLVRGVRLLGAPESELGPLGVPGDPDFLWSSELKKFARTPSPEGAPGASLASI